MGSTAKRFQEERRDWSSIKHNILGPYMTLFLGKLGRPGTRLYYVDGFAGPGRYEDGERGSPLIAAEIAADPPQASRKGVMKCINVEQDDVVAENLERETDPFVQQGIVTNLRGDFKKHLDSILATVGDSPAFFFLDPFGTECADVETLQRIAARKGTTEVFVRYDDLRVKRLHAWAQNNLLSNQAKSQRTASAFNDRVARLSSEQGVNCLLEDDPQWREVLVRGYVELVTQDPDTRCFDHGLCYPIRNPQTNGHKYFLVHFCNHPDGYVYMANFMAVADRSYQKKRAERQTDMFGDQATQQLELLPILEGADKSAEQRIVEQVRQTILAVGEERGWSKMHVTVQNRTLFAAIVDRLGFQATRREWVAALNQLNEQGILTATGTKDKDTVRFSGTACQK